MNGSNVDASVEVGEPIIEGNAGGASVWWKFVAPVGATFVEIDLEGTTFDADLAVYTGSALNNLTPVLSFEDAEDIETGFTVVPGVTYYIQIDGFNAGSGAATGDIQFTLQAEA